MPTFVPKSYTFGWALPHVLWFKTSFNQWLIGSLTCFDPRFNAHRWQVSLPIITHLQPLTQRFRTLQDTSGQSRSNINRLPKTFFNIRVLQEGSRPLHHPLWPVKSFPVVLTDESMIINDYWHLSCIDSLWLYRSLWVGFCIIEIWGSTLPRFDLFCPFFVVNPSCHKATMRMVAIQKMVTWGWQTWHWV